MSYETRWGTRRARRRLPRNLVSYWRDGRSWTQGEYFAAFPDDPAAINHRKIFAGTRTANPPTSAPNSANSVSSFPTTVIQVDAAVASASNER
jgi:hypothetical protein